MSTKDGGAKDNPAMSDEKAGEEYSGTTGKERAVHAGELHWLTQNMVDELVSWGRTGGARGHVRLKSDCDNTVKGLTDAVGKLLGERVIPESTPKTESQPRGRIEQAGKIIRGLIRVMTDQVAAETGKQLKGKDNIVQ